MARVCQVTGKHTIAGNHVSKANNKVKRVFKPNIQKKRFFFPEEDRWITLKISTKGMKIINKRGLAAVVKELRAEGHKI
ncbi:MAG: 50S ribosomal protein L28 [Bacteroidia bacterium]